MKKIELFAYAFLALTLLVGCTSPPLAQSHESGAASSTSGSSAVSMPGAMTALPDSGSSLSPAETAETAVLNQELLSLLDSDNAGLRQNRSGRCYTEITLRGTVQLTYFSPYLAIQFAPEGNPSDAWREEGSSGFYEENPLVDHLMVLQIDLCEEIDPRAPSVGQQTSLQQLLPTEEPITYASLCEVFGQTPALSHTDDVYYDATSISGDPAARGADAEQDHTLGEKISGGTDQAVFSTDGVRITVQFIRVQEEYFAFHARIEKMVE